MVKPSRVLITGATGFVGRHLISFLSGGRKNPAGEFFGTCFPERPEHCSDLLAEAPFLKLDRVDLRSEDAVFDLLKRTRPERIFHLAAVSQVRVSWVKRRETLETNLMGTFSLLEAARRHAPGSRILFVSSSDVYGLRPSKKKDWPFREEERNAVLSPYAFTKVAGEILSEFYALREKLHAVVARPFPHTGPGQTADFVCSDWARQIALIEKNQIRPVIRVGNLRLRRDYSDVRDVVRAYDLLIKKGRPGEIYNVCSGEARPLGDVLRMLLSLSPRKIRVRVEPSKLRPTDIPYLAGSNRKIAERTGWKPRIPLIETLEDVLEYWRSRV